MTDGEKSELESTTMRYHMSRTKLAAAEVLTGYGKPKVAHEVEYALGQRCPESMISRLEAVFTRPVQDFWRLGLDGGYVHEVRVTEPFQMHDTYWLGQIQLAYLKKKYEWSAYPNLALTNMLLNDLTCKYWSGAESENPLWECLSKSAAVIRLVSEEYVTIEDPLAGLNAHLNA